MPFQFDTETGADPPKGSHLVLMTGTGEGIAIPVGAKLLIVEDPAAPHKILPVVLVAISRNHMVLKCACGQRNCNRVMRASFKVEGRHPPKFQEG